MLAGTQPRQSQVRYDRFVKEHWPQIAATGYRLWQEHGRGALVVDVEEVAHWWQWARDPMDGQHLRIKADYMTVCDGRLAAFVKAYRPWQEVVVAFRGTQIDGVPLCWVFAFEPGPKELYSKGAN